jgi:spermidine/putrescine transport system permease protein
MKRNPTFLWLLVIFAFLYVPIVTLVVLSFNDSGMQTAWSTFSLRWYRELLTDTDILIPAWHTLIVASVASVVSTIIGTLLALGIARMRQTATMNAALYVPMVIPDIVLAISLLTFFTATSLDLGLHTIIISHIVFCIAFVTAVVRTRLDNFDQSLVEASTDLGAGSLYTFRRVTLPVIAPGVLAGALLSFTMSFDEFVIAFFTAGTSSSAETLPMTIYSMLRFGVTPEINALATCIIGVSFILVLISQRFNKEAL